MRMSSKSEVLATGASQVLIINGPKEVGFKSEIPLFKYQGDKDSVLEVSKDDYNNCNTATPIAKHDDGHTVIKLDKSGPHYFISGVAEHCKHNEKVMVVVMADRSHKSSSESPPSPAPAGEESPADKNPHSSPNGASSVVMSLLCFIGGFACFLSW
ncbi:Cupredoxin [Cynara cardunculus var. scolymus]|uniref:Cupredoxin n=1 Tax=Cynara cardunculus var. scolymus TaxID=59895 RepID=A0A103XYC5_CYNCS|nr:Cupredoxin [Cynara cardunculus var. scolymus]